MTPDIPATPEERQEWLKNPQNRAPFLRRGAGAIYYRGDLSNPDSVEIIVSTRSNAVGAGLAHFGGLGEDEDVVPGDELKTGINNALREGQEEMEELLGYRPALAPSSYVFLYAARDDKFFIKNGRGFTVDARIHACRTPDTLWEQLFPSGTKHAGRHPDHAGVQETDKAEVLSFREALKRQDDYHYPHEYFSLWVMAAKLMKTDIAALAEEISHAMHPARINFSRVAGAMFSDLQELESFLGPGYKGVLSAHEEKFLPPPKPPHAPKPS